MTETEYKLTLANEKLVRNEKILIHEYQSLKDKELELKELNDELTTSEEELQAANEELHAINEELFNKNEIINRQNDELKATLQYLKETQTVLLQSEKMASLGILTAGVAHEINNPLNFIKGSYIGLRNYFDKNSHIANSTILYLLKSLNVGLERVSSIVKGLNQFSRDSASNNENCNLHSIIDNCLVMLNNKLKYRLHIKKEFFHDEINISGNVGKLHQVFLNIIDNAEQAVDTDATISIKTYLRDEDAIVEISDNGEGIAEENIQKITDPFYTTKAPGKGTGLGLSITYSIIKEHNGHLEFESTLGKGTTVRVILPKQQPIIDTKKQIN